MKKKIIAILTTCLILTATLIPMTASAYSSYIIDSNEVEQNRENYRTYVNGSINIGAIINYPQGNYQQSTENFWMSQSLTTRILYPKMNTYTFDDLAGTGVIEAGQTDEKEIYGEIIIENYDIGQNQPIYKEYQDIKWGRETIETTKMVEWEQNGTITINPTQADSESGLIQGKYNIYIELENVLCYGKNLVDDEEYTGQNHSLITEFEINLDILTTEWENKTDEELKNMISRIYSTPLVLEDYYIATNIASGETERHWFDLQKTVDRNKGTITFGINAPEFDDESLWKISGIMPLEVVTTNEDYPQLIINHETKYTCLRDSEYYEQLIVEGEKVEFPSIVDLGSWLGNAVGGFMEAEIFQGATIGGIFIMFVAFSMVMWLLKLFAGG